jgi:hypothetical protein
MKILFTEEAWKDFEWFLDCKAQDQDHGERSKPAVRVS